MARGLFISFEGGEGLGKSTQIAMLRRALIKRGLKLLVTREPGGTPVGERLRKILKTEPCDPLTEIFVLQASRAEHVKTKILPALNKGMTVITDRFSDSSLVYQGLCRGLGLAFVGRLNQIATAGLQPDIVILLDGTNQRLHTKSRRDKFDQADALFHRHIRQGFLKLARANKCIKVVKADQTRQSLHHEILGLLEPHLKNRTSR